MPCLVVIRKKEDRPEAADRSKSKARNQRWMDFLRSTTGCAFYLFIRRAHPRKCLEAKWLYLP